MRIKPDSSIGHATVSMPDQLAIKVEENLWWKRGREAIFSVYLKKAVHASSVNDILEVGCGSGDDLLLLSRYGTVTAIEPSPILANRARSRKIDENVYEGSTEAVDLSKKFDLLCIFDVLEHIADDSGFLDMLSQEGKTGHWLLISVPSNPFLFGPHDILLGHYRRYSKKSLYRLLNNNGYEIIDGGHFAFFLFPALLAWRLGEKLLSFLGYKQKSINIGRFPRPLNVLMAGILRIEAALSRFIRFPFGLWLIILAKEQGKSK